MTWCAIVGAVTGRFAHGEAHPAAFARLIEAEGVGLRGRVSAGPNGEPNRFELL